MMLFFRFLYTDKLNLQADNVMGTLYASKKYLIPNLKQKCITYLETNLNAQNACMLLYQSKQFDEQKLVNKCLKVIDRKTSDALKSDTFCDVDHATVLEIVSRDTLNIKEIYLFEYINKWCEAECGRKNLKPTGENRRTVLGDILYQIRMTEMTVEKFADGPARSGILSVQESNDVLLYLVSKNKPVVSFSTMARGHMSSKDLIYLSIGSIIFNADGQMYTPYNQPFREIVSSIVIFYVNAPIIIKGIGICGGHEGSTRNVNISLNVFDQYSYGNMLPVNDTKVYQFRSDGTKIPVHILFDSELQLEPRVNYSIKVCMEGPCIYSCRPIGDVSIGGVEFTFSDQQMYNSHQYSTGEQIADILFKLP